MSKCPNRGSDPSVTVETVDPYPVPSEESLQRLRDTGEGKQGARLFSSIDLKSVPPSDESLVYSLSLIYLCQRRTGPIGLLITYRSG